MIAIVDYGVGNLFSLRSSFGTVCADSGTQIVVSGDAEVIRSADRIVLPGVGAFADAAQKLRDSGLDKVIIEEAEKGKHILGICLGMQLLLERSFEYGEHKGLGLIKGSVVPVSDAPGFNSSLKIPHIGWNALHFGEKKHSLFRYVNEGDCVYFVHSFYAAQCEESVIATAEYGAELTAAVACKNVFGCQFHPEKSGKTGLAIIRAFCEKN